MPEADIRVFKPSFPASGKIAAYIDVAARTGQFSNGGPLVTELEERLAAHFGVPSSMVAMCSSGTMALEGALATCQQDGSPWEVPSWTFTATPGSVLRAGKPLTFVDVDESQRAAFSPSSAYAVDVLPFGARPDWTRPDAPRQTVLVDAAASFDGCKDFEFPPGARVGVIVSLHATKSLPAGEGGVFFSNDEAWVQDFRRWANFGMWGSRVSQVPGTNAKMSELTAAVALASLDEWPEKRLRWIELAERSFHISEDLGVLPTGGRSRDLATPYWNIALKDEATRVGLEAFLTDGGVETRRWWGDGCHNMPAYRGIPRGELAQTEKHSRTILGLPLHLGLSSQDFERIESLILGYLDDNPA